VLSAGQDLDTPTGLSVDGPDLLVANLTPAVFASQVLRTSLATGGQSVLSQVSSPSRVGAVTVGSPGAIYVVDESAGSVSSVDPVSGALAHISSGNLLVGPIGIAVEASGQLVVADASGLVLRVDPLTGAQTQLASGGNLVTPFGIAVEADGHLVITDKGTDKLVRIDPATGVQTVVSSFSTDPWGVAVVAGDPSPAPGPIPALPGRMYTVGLLAALGLALVVLARRLHRAPASLR
jgi:streptogramin lyase